MMVRFPVEPRLARLLISANDHGVAERGVWLAALLSERDPFRSARHDGGQDRRGGRDMGRGGPVTTSQRTRSDVVDRVSAIESFLAGNRTGLAATLTRGALSGVERAASQLSRLVDRELSQDLSGSKREMGREFADGDEALMRALLDAFPDRLVRRRDIGSNKGVMVSGRGVRLAPGSGVLDAELFLAVDVEGGAGEALVRQASAVERGWLSEEQLTRRVDCFWHPTAKEIQSRSRVLWDDLVIEERPAELPGDEAQARLLAEMARKSWQGVVPRGDTRLDQWLCRVANLRLWRPELEFPEFDAALLCEVLIELSWGKKNIGEVERADWVAACAGRLTYEQQRRLDAECPPRVKIPTGRMVELVYERDRPPVLAIKIQDAFGWRETPTVAGGRVRVLLHLLAPNQRPQQVTDDLASFWSTTYSVVRKELRARYPKHAWPEDPTKGV